MVLKNTLAILFFVLLFVVPNGSGLLWWKVVPDRWWAHCLYAPAQIILGLLLFIVTYYASFNASGQMSGGLAIAVMPLCAGMALAVIGYYSMLTFRFISRAWCLQ